MKVQSVHPLVRVNYYARFLGSILNFLPFYSVIYQLNLSSMIYIYVALFLLFWPHTAYLAAAKFPKSKKFELWVNTNIETFVFGLFIPVLMFNPIIILFGFVVCAAGISIGGFKFLFFRISSFFVGIAVNLPLVGFKYNGEISILTVASTGLSITAVMIATSYVAYINAKKINATKLIVKEQKQKIEIENAKTIAALEKVNIAYTELDNELKEAAKYVIGTLPDKIDQGKIRTDWSFIPSASLGGDAFGYHWIDNENFAIYLLDVSGHGVGAALLSVSVINVIRSPAISVTKKTKPDKVLEDLNKIFDSDSNNDMFFTIWYGVYNSKTKMIKFASAGHPPAIFIQEKCSSKCFPVLLSTSNSVIGGFQNAAFKMETYKIENSGRLYVYSDGVYELRKPNGHMWRLTEFIEFMSNNLEINKSRIDMLLNHVRNIYQCEQFQDDFTIFEVQFD